MSESFLKFRRMHRFGTLTKSLLCAFSTGVALASVLLLLSKLEIIYFDPIIILLSSVGISLAVGCVAFFAHFKTSKKIAAKIDRDFSLNEKAETMYAFRFDETEMVKLQRADAEEHLKALSTKGFGFGKIWLFITVFALTLLMLFTAMIVPAKAEPPKEDEPEINDPYEITMWQITALKDLIDDVKASAMQKSAKELVTAQLEGLLTKLENTDTVSLMEEYVLLAIKEIYVVVDETNALIDMKKLMSASDDPLVKLFSSVLGSYELPITLSLMEDVRALAEGRDGKEPYDVSASLTAFLEGSGLSAESALFKALLSFAADMASVPDADSADMFYTAHVSAIRTAIIGERINISVRDTVVKRLVEIFDLSDEDLPNPEDYEDGSDYEDREEEDEEDKGPQDGGLGGNETLYGSNDAVFDPASGEYVPYGEIINNSEYYPSAQEMLREEDLPEELKKFLEEYYGILFDGSKDSADDGN